MHWLRAESQPGSRRQPEGLCLPRGWPWSQASEIFQQATREARWDQNMKRHWATSLMHPGESHPHLCRLQQEINTAALATSLEKEVRQNCYSVCDQKTWKVRLTTFVDILQIICISLLEITIEQSITVLRSLRPSTVWGIWRGGKNKRSVRCGAAVNLWDNRPHPVVLQHRRRYR